MFALDQLCAGLSAHAGSMQEVVFWQRLRYIPMSLAPGFWIRFSLSYARGNAAEFVRRQRWLILLFFLALPALAVVFWKQLFLGVIEPVVPGMAWVILLGNPAMGFHAAMILAYVVVLANLETTLRASVGTMRWKVKFMALGLAILLGVRIYLSSQDLIHAHEDLLFIPLSALSSIMAVGFIWWSFIRSREWNMDIYPSHKALYHSLAAVLIGIYLLLVGLLSRWLAHFDTSAFWPVKSFLMLVAFVVLSMLILSNHMRQFIRQIVSRHLRRPHYDYRSIWSQFASRTASVIDTQDYARMVVRMLSEIFEALSVTVWTVDADEHRLINTASTALHEPSSAPSWPSGENGASNIIEALRSKSGPFDMETTDEEWVRELRQRNPDVFKKGGNRICVPLLADRKLLGLITLGDRVNGLPYSVEEFDLLKTLGDQAAARLLNIRLSERLLEARELAAFQTMSAFFVHDFKNTVSTLSLMLQNLPKHFDDPAFRKDAIEAFGKIVGRINGMIGRLTLLRQKLEIKAAETDLNEVARHALDALDAASRARIHTQFELRSPVCCDAEQIQKVALNLLLNALEAGGEGKLVELRVTARSGWAVLSVADQGCGMSQDFIQRSLFRPFQTTKKNGMGIGLFHSKMILEAHGGRFEVESQEGRGSVFRILLPMSGGPIEARIADR